MKRRFIIALIFILFTNLLLCEENNTAGYLNKATTYYNSDDYKNALDYYIEAVQLGEKNTGTTYYRLAYSWENVNPNASKYFSKFYSIAAYCFERDNDTENKYYSYSINKEEKFNTNHDNLNENKIEKIINKDLTQKKIDYRKGKENKKSDAPVIILALIIGLFCTSKFGNKSGKTTSQTNKKSYKQEISENESSSKKGIQVDHHTIKYYCKLCGEYSFKISSLNNGHCPMNKTGKFHVLYQGGKPYECVLCGTQSDHLRTLVRGKCFYSPNHTGFHIPYEGNVRNPYICKYCGTKEDSLEKLVRHTCIQNRNGKFHVPLDRQ